MSELVLTKKFLLPAVSNCGIAETSIIFIKENGTTFLVYSVSNSIVKVDLSNPSNLETCSLSSEPVFCSLSSSKKKVVTISKAGTISVINLNSSPASNSNNSTPNQKAAAKGMLIETEFEIRGEGFLGCQLSPNEKDILAYSQDTLNNLLIYEVKPRTPRSQPGKMINGGVLYAEYLNDFLVLSCGLDGYVHLNGGFAMNYLGGVETETEAQIFCRFSNFRSIFPNFKNEEGNEKEEYFIIVQTDLHKLEVLRIYYDAKKKGENISDIYICFSIERTGIEIKSSIRTVYSIKMNSNGREIVVSGSSPDIEIITFKNSSLSFPIEEKQENDYYETQIVEIKKHVGIPIEGKKFSKVDRVYFADFINCPGIEPENLDLSISEKEGYNHLTIVSNTKEIIIFNRKENSFKVLKTIGNEIKSFLHKGKDIFILEGNEGILKRANFDSKDITLLERKNEILEKSSEFFLYEENSSSLNGNENKEKLNIAIQKRNEIKICSLNKNIFEENFSTFQKDQTKSLAHFHNKTYEDEFKSDLNPIETFSFNTISDFKIISSLNFSDNRKQNQNQKEEIKPFAILIAKEGPTFKDPNTAFIISLLPPFSITKVSYSSEPTALAFSLESKTIVIGYKNGSISLFSFDEIFSSFSSSSNNNNIKSIKRLEKRTEEINSLSFNSIGNKVAAAQGNLLLLWDIENLKGIRMPTNTEISTILAMEFFESNLVLVGKGGKVEFRKEFEKVVGRYPKKFYDIGIRPRKVKIEGNKILVLGTNYLVCVVDVEIR